jgi:16S rRNA (adenine1518-N6/adenine1519-N6)-dimethyltransferase
MIRPVPERRAATDVAWFHTVVRQVFLHRRKNLRHVLSELWPDRFTKPEVDALLARLGLDGRLRAEALDVDQFRKLSQALKESAGQSAENVPDSQPEEAES